jgi:RHS repeat-associated protein
MFSITADPCGIRKTMKTTRIRTIAMTMAMGMIAGLQASVTEHQPPAPLPEFKTPEQLAKWRSEQSLKSQPSASSQEGGVFYTGKPYLVESASYSFKYREYNPEMGRWTTVDPSGFPDGANNQIYANNNSISSIDSNGLDIYQITNPTQVGGAGHSAMISGNSSTGYTYQSFGNFSASIPGSGNGYTSNYFPTLSQAMSFANNLGYSNYNQWNTSASADAAAQNAFNNYQASNSYNPTLNNCQDAVNAGLTAAGLDHNNSNVPNTSQRYNSFIFDVTHGKVKELE